ncbi:2-amino-4-hydroxy-6-hydroxymethyldihydropteridine diphosphokinase [Paenibacillaceae bacterium]|nr:2-amino-4-hydroxy-6-hydroxymethyldihydropteridine diphosphokinase [Paenibacillaceae bacterium]
MDKSFPAGNNQHNIAAERAAYIALGSNLGDRQGLLEQALQRLDAHPLIHIGQVSSLYETEPVGYMDQPSFLNMAAALRTELPALELLDVMLQVENELGRVREIPNGPRTIDLDLLYYEGVTLETERLTLPHPRMLERAFVLVPLCELLREAAASDQPFLRLVERTGAQLSGKEGVLLWNTINWRSVSAPSGS